jgi:hypothetical protein
MFHEKGAYYTINDSFEVLYKGYFGWVNCDTLYKLNANIDECWDRDRQREFGIIDTILTVNFYGIRKMLIIDRYSGPSPCDTTSTGDVLLWMQKTFLVSGVGIIEKWYEGGPGRYLTGAIVDGVVYGNPNVIEIDKENTKIPGKTSLFQNYSNPFNRQTMIRYQVSQEGTYSIEIYDIAGCRIIKEDRYHNAPGRYEWVWCGTNDRGESIPSGIYLISLIFDGKSNCKKVLLLK